MPLRVILPPEEQEITTVRTRAADPPQPLRARSLALSASPPSRVREPLLFSPKFSDADWGRIVSSFDEVPTYLFRLYCCGEETPDFFQLPQWKAAQHLSNHLGWSRQGKERNLVSWSSSLLFLLQYGLYRHKTDRPKPSWSDIKLLVLDTRAFPKGTFIQDLEAIRYCSAYSDSLERAWRLRATKFYNGEYLSQGCLDVWGHCTETSMQQLIDAGLFTVCPDLNMPEQWDGWVLPVIAIRRKIRQRDKGSDEEDVRTAVAVAQTCFGSRWALPLAAMLLSLQPRKPWDRAILDEFRLRFSDEEVEALEIESMNFDPESGRMAEMKLYRDMMKAIHSHFQEAKARGRRDVDELAYRLGGLTVQF